MSTSRVAYQVSQATETPDSLPLLVRIITILPLKQSLMRPRPLTVLLMQNPCTIHQRLILQSGLLVLPRARIGSRGAADSPSNGDVVRWSRGGRGEGEVV